MQYRKTTLTLVLSAAGMVLCQHAYADDTVLTASESQAVLLPTVVIEAMDEGDPIKTYVDYKHANVTRNNLDKKDIPQTIDTIDVSKYKIYGANDLSIMLQGTPGVTTTYDMRGDGIMLRGFSADSGDIYRDGVRESGQVRRSTANVERIEILKGPASVLYGRSGGGGVINMVTKFANFESKSSVGGYLGSYQNVGAVIDLNRPVNDNWAIRVTGEKGDSNSFRNGIGSQIEMISPSISYRSDDQRVLWTTQYTYDKITRVPDRGPSYENLPAGTSIKMGFAQDGDYVYDELQTIRSDLKYEFLPDWKFHWALSYRQAEQNFDHFYTGTYCGLDGYTLAGRTCTTPKGYISQTYYWQQTSNKTTSSTWDISGAFHTGKIKHNLLIGADWTYEQREPILANRYENGTSSGETLYGYVNPLTGERYNTRDGGVMKINTHNYNQGTNYGVFVQDLISLNAQLKLMLGLRYDSYESSTTNKLETSANYQRRNTVAHETWSPNIGLVWQPVEPHSFYASFSRSFSPFGGSMGVSVVSATEDLDAFDYDPQYNDQYEIGVKSEWFNRRLSTQLSVFHIEKHNIRDHEDPDDDTSPYIIVGEQQSKGAELSFIGRLWEQLYVRGGYGYTDAKIKEDLVEPELEGNYLQNVAKHTGNLFFRYLATEQWYAEIGATYMGSFYTSDENTTKMPNWTRLDAAIGFKNQHWGATLAVNNLTDKEYWRSSSMPGTPRNYLFRINYYFD
jgi:iron complex outermembrane receptor protein